MEWTQTLTIIATLLGVTAWLDHKHRQEMDKMDERMAKADERWKWLFERTDNKLDQIRGK